MLTKRAPLFPAPPEVANDPEFSAVFAPFAPFPPVVFAFAVTVTYAPMFELYDPADPPLPAAPLPLAPFPAPPPFTVNKLPKDVAPPAFPLEPAPPPVLPFDPPFPPPPTVMVYVAPEVTG